MSDDDYEDVPQGGDVESNSGSDDENGEPAPFSLGPGLVHNDVIDFSKRSGSKLYEQATYKLSDELYDCEPGGMRSFQELFRERCSAYGWDLGVFDIPERVDDLMGNTTNLLKYHGKITLPHRQKFAATHCQDRSRSAQDAVMAYRCLMASLSKEAINKVTIWKKDYMIKGIPNGPCLYKVILRESHIDTNATVSHIRTQLSSLDLYLPTINHDISKFNRHVKQLVESLESRGDSTDSSDLLSNLFKGYKAASDRVFIDYIDRREADYHEDVPINPDRLMFLADNKYKQLVQAGRWNAPSASEEKILALEAKLEKFGKKKPNTQPSNNRVRKSNKERSGRKERREDPAWMSEPPPDGQPKTKEMDGKEWKWCTHHKKWGRHHADTCRQKLKQDQDNSERKDGGKKLKLANALAAMMENPEDSSSNNESSDEDQD